MYSRDFGGIRSEGQLHNMQQELYEQQSADYYEPPIPEPPPAPPEKDRDPKGLAAGLFDKFKDIFKTLQLDDFILIAIGILLLLDGDSSNDMLLIFIVVLLFF